MGRPPKDPTREDTDVLILRAAERAFADRGYANTRLADIAEAVGIRRPSLLYHFNSKQALYDAVVRGAFERVGASLAEALSTVAIGPAERLETVVGAMTGFAADNPGAISVVLRELVDPSATGGPLIIHGLGGLVDTITAALAPSAPPGVPVRAAVMQLVATYLLRRGAGVGEDLWGQGEFTLALARRLLLADA